MPSPTTYALAAAAALLPAAIAETLTNETVLGVYMFHRHGDRTAKKTPPANLTTLGYREVYTSGDYYRNRYIAASAPYQINGIETDIVKQSQITVTAPDDDVLEESAQGFLQGLYPPVGSSLDTSTLKNGTEVTAPLDGYQLIPIGLVDSGSGEEDNGWLQASTGCAKATVSSNNYFLSDEYESLLASTQDFYDRFTPVINNTFSASDISYKNAYTIYDLINVAEIHNATFDPNSIVSDADFFQLRTLANAHEWGLAYNASDKMRAVAGMTLAAEILDFLNSTIADDGADKIGIQFGSYGTFSSFFGLAMPDIETMAPALMGIADYASAMSFELFTNGSSDISASNFPSENEMYVRFLFHNGTTSNTSEPVAYPLFGSGSTEMQWSEFQKGMNDIAIGTTEQWCKACGNTTGTCAAYADDVNNNGDSSSGSSTEAERSGNGLSPAVNGVIGAMVTLAVVLGLEALILLVGGFRVVSKKRLAQPVTQVNGGEMKA